MREDEFDYIFEDLDNEVKGIHNALKDDLELLGELNIDSEEEIDVFNLDDFCRLIKVQNKYAIQMTSIRLMVVQRRKVLETGDFQKYSDLVLKFQEYTEKINTDIRELIANFFYGEENQEIFIVCLCNSQ